ncbi:M15 family metallopeptidase [Macrococcus capreoli]|uniref:M15 family metallopeptidase n=1 Tax=Macrococcus capreoli TaxID=2982690 RepID=UPI003F43D67C
MKRILIASVLLLSSCSLPSTSEKSTTEAPQKKVVKPKVTVPQYNKQVIKGVTYINGIIIVNKQISLPSTYNPGENKEARAALNQMIKDAAQDNMHLVIRSGYRSYADQQALYNSFVAKDGQAMAETYSAKPGQSEHQTGLAFDIGSRESVADISIQFGQTEEGNWLKAHAHEYGFIIRYGKGKIHITGYQYEPWHIRYVGKNHAARLYRSGQTLEEYLGVYKPSVNKKKVTQSKAANTKAQPTTEKTTTEQSTTEQPTIEQTPTVQSSIVNKQPSSEMPISTEQSMSKIQISTEQPLFTR